MFRTSEFLRGLRAELDEADPGWRVNLRADLDSTYPGWESFSITVWDQSGVGREVVILSNRERITEYVEEGGLP
ncbi:MAG TPA: hypothetical protein VM533_20810 [Fimbriiglobus sp.]|nr:hypothetical protein [Fimbriiglobus sp.]